MKFRFHSEPIFDHFRVPPRILSWAMCSMKNRNQVTPPTMDDKSLKWKSSYLLKVLILLKTTSKQRSPRDGTHNNVGGCNKLAPHVT